ncbi:radical SAM protein [Paenibacillus forsythiae]|nr:radical SAM protein [Paenibacillus forsythiae]
MLVLVPFISERCNLNCIYCMMKDERVKVNQERKLTLEDHKRVFRQAVDLGCKTIVISGLGEPFMDPYLYNKQDNTFPLLDLAEELDLYTVVFTNGMMIDSKLAQALYKRRISLIIKLSSLNESVFSELNHHEIQFVDYREKDGRLTRIPHYLKCLIEAGFSDGLDGNATRLINDVIITRKNMDEITEIIHFSLRNHMLTCIDPLVIKSEAERNRDELAITDSENRILYEKVKSTFSDYDMGMYDLSNCIIHNYGLVYDLEGRIRRCLAVPSDAGTIHDRSLAEHWSRLLEEKQAANLAYHISKTEDIFGVCPGRRYYSFSH